MKRRVHLLRSYGEVEESTFSQSEHVNLAPVQKGRRQFSWSCILIARGSTMQIICPAKSRLPLQRRAKRASSVAYLHLILAQIATLPIYFVNYFIPRIY